MAITADFRDPFYFLSLQFQIYLLFPLVIKSLGGYLQVHAVLHYVQKMKVYFSVKRWTLYQVDIQQILLDLFYILLIQNCAENVLKLTLQLQIIWYWSNCEVHWLSGFLLSFKEHSYMRIAHAEVQEEGQQGTWEPKIMSGNNEGTVGTFQDRLLWRISFFFPCITEARANNSRKPFMWPR